MGISYTKQLAYTASYPLKDLIKNLAKVIFIKFTSIILYTHIHLVRQSHPKRHFYTNFIVALGTLRPLAIYF